MRNQNLLCSEWLKKMKQYNHPLISRVQMAPQIGYVQKPITQRQNENIRSLVDLDVGAYEYAEEMSAIFLELVRRKVNRVNQDFKKYMMGAGIENLVEERREKIEDRKELSEFERPIIHAANRVELIYMKLLLID